MKKGDVIVSPGGKVMNSIDDIHRSPTADSISKRIDVTLPGIGRKNGKRNRHGGQPGLKKQS
jgi:hypothetical protein